MLATSIRILCWASRNCAAILLFGVSSLACAAADSGRGVPSVSGLPVTSVSAAGALNNSAEFEERLLLVDINHQDLKQAVLVLEDKAGKLYLWSMDLQRWHLRVPATISAIEYQGEKYFSLDVLSNVSHVYDAKKLTLMIEVRPEAFTSTVWVTRYIPIPPPVKAGPGGFFNYELFAADSPEATQRSGLFELGYFNRYGVGTSNVLAENLSSNAKVTRLDTTWTIDYPEKMQSLRLGDAINVPGSWGRSVRFGGIQFGTNFGTQPGFLTFPPQSVAGQAVLPSTVEVFINNSLISRQSVPPGPFAINNLPIVTGAGEVQLVVRDLFGREQLITRPFYASQMLLREGLENFSYELGFVRENFGINSNDYGSWLGTGTYRRGMSENLTGEVRAEAMPGQVTAGMGGDYLMPQFGTLSTYMAGSQSGSSQGGLLLLGIERQALLWSFGAQSQWISSGFTQVGLTSLQLAPSQVSSANLGYALHKGGSIGAAYVMQLNRDQADTRIASLSYSVSLGKIGSLSTSAIRSFAEDANTSIFALLSISLDQATTFSGSHMVNTANDESRRESTATLQRNLPAGEGYGYRLQARTDKSKEAAYTYQNNVGTYSVVAAQNGDVTSTYLSVAGGMAVLGGDAFMSRRIDQSFAVARVADYPNVRILADNQPAGRTGASGSALIPRLRAYDKNVISIDQRDLPLDAKIDAIKLSAVPYYRSGVDLKFPIRHANGATFTLLLEDGKPMPLGASVQETGNNIINTVGYNGEVYISDLGTDTRLTGAWRGQHCEFNIHFVAGTDPLPDLGVFICKGVKP